MNALEAALYARLAAASALTTLLASTTEIHNTEAPQSAAYPFVLFAKQSGMDDNDNPHRARQFLYLVKGVVEDLQATTGAGPTLKTAGAIDDAIDATLHKQLLTVTGWTNFWLVREGPDVHYQEDAPGGRRYYHAGGLYRVRLAQ